MAVGVATLIFAIDVALQRIPKGLSVVAAVVLAVAVGALAHVAVRGATAHPLDHRSDQR